MKNSEYWQKRFEELEDRRTKEAAAYYKDVEKQYRIAQNNIERDLERWYQRLADNNGISYAAAKRLLNKNELAEFQWSVEEYIKKGKENAVNQKWMKELENASARVHISQLEAMKTAIQQHNEILFTQLKTGLTNHLSETLEDTFYRNAFEIAKGTGVGSVVPYLDTKKIEQVLNRTWAADGSRFSDRIWSNKQKLVGKLHTELAQSIIRGEAPDKAIKRLAKEMGVSRKQAGRLIMTETAAISSAATLESYKELGIKQYQILATLDNRTSIICQEMDHKVFDLKDYQVGMTAPPYHPFCRTTTIPYFNDEFTTGEQRSAKDESTGKTYYVPANITYKEWKQEYIKLIKSDVERPIGHNNPKAAEKWLENHLGIKSTNYTEYGNIEVINKIDRALQRIYEEYPILNGFIDRIEFTDKISQVAVARIGLDKNGNIKTDIRFSSLYCSDLKSIEKLIEQQVNDKNWTKKDGLYGILKHEMIHMVEYAKTLEKYAVKNRRGSIEQIQEAMQAIKKGELADIIKINALKSCNLEDSDDIISKKLGVYATKNSSEFIAEAGSEYPSSKLSYVVIQEIKRILEE